MSRSTNSHNSPTKKKRQFLRPWKTLGWGRKTLRVVWITLVSLWLFSVLQVLLGIFFNPPLTPLMVQRFFQQAFDGDRSINFERDYVPLDSISPNLVTAVVYAEDGLFLYHHGFDVKQMKIATKENKSGKRFRGGSTISQQTAKNAFLPHSRTMLRKAFEAYYTLMIETFWSKRRIMEVYLNIIEFGDGIYGAEAAAQHYFGHSANCRHPSNAIRRILRLTSAATPPPSRADFPGVRSILTTPTPRSRNATTTKRRLSGTFSNGKLRIENYEWFA